MSNVIHFRKAIPKKDYPYEAMQRLREFANQEEEYIPISCVAKLIEEKRSEISKLEKEYYIIYSSGLTDSFSIDPSRGHKLEYLKTRVLDKLEDLQSLKNILQEYK